jgi:hypothetical protein
MTVLLLLLGVWILLAAFLAAFLGKCMAVGLGEEPPDHVSAADWARITERHMPHVVPFQRRAR